MYKVALIVCSMLALCYVASTTNVIVDGCLYQHELWGSMDGMKFYICIPDQDKAIEQNCPTGTFFIRNSTVMGCVPFESVSPSCVYLGEPEPCTGDNLNQPQPAADPTQFYLCPTEGADPLLLTCVNGGAFIKQDGFLGCFEWTEWREVRGCYD